MKAVILGNAHIADYTYMRRFVADAFVICCDGGVRHARALSLTPDRIIGDLDSADDVVLAGFLRDGVPCDRFPSEKDETDMALCLDYAIRAGAASVDILGGIGDRMDHTLANLFLLEDALRRGVTVRLVHEQNMIWLIDKQTRFSGTVGGFVSLIPISDACGGVVTEGLYYPLRGETLYRALGRGISNQFNAPEAAVTIQSGLLLVVLSKD